NQLKEVSTYSIILESNITDLADKRLAKTTYSFLTLSNNNLIYTTQVGATGGSTYGRKVAVDSLGNSYVVGSTTVGINGQTQKGNVDYFIAKYANGESTPVWTNQVGVSGGTTMANAVTVDKSGNIYVVGGTDVGINGQIKQGGYDLFVVKYPATGESIPVWTREVGSLAGNRGSHATGVAVDSTGNLYVSGETNSGIYGNTVQGPLDSFVVKYPATGESIPVWVKQFGATGGTLINCGLSIDSSGNVYTTGSTNVGILGQTQKGAKDYYVVKYDSNGAFVWAKQVGVATATTYANSLAVDSNGVVYVIGNTTAGINGQTQQSNQDYFLVAYNPIGVVLWSRQFGGFGSYTGGNVIAVDSANNIYVGGSTFKGIHGQTQTGLEDYFIAKYLNGQTTPLWTKQVGTSGGYTYATGLNVSNTGSIFVSGTTNLGLSGGTKKGSFDYFLAKYN
ncbi:MAG: SBBP repeat-containing protein, partial [Burkholderiales bacterium]|nr:SBBP repeat-containing protein [Burkholderiales bacterium]